MTLIEIDCNKKQTIYLYIINLFKKRDNKSRLNLIATDASIVVKFFDFQKIRKIPLSIIYIIFIIIIFGIISLKSADHSKVLMYKHILSSLIFFLVFLLIASIHPSILYSNAYRIYSILLIGIIITSILGHVSMGARRWLEFAGIKIQSSEFMKIGIIFAMAKYFSKVNIKQIGSLYKIFIPILISVIPIIFVILQPDLGTAMIMTILFVTIMFISGVKLWKFILCGIIVLISAPIIWSNLHDYQKLRITNFINPENDKLGSGYNIMQSKIAIGSGGLIGNGIGLGTQTRLKFVPENETDFIFTVIGEEMGFIGCLLLIICYSFIVIYGYNTSISAKNFFLKTISFGSVFLIFLHIAINTGMTLGIFPVVGVPLPLVSYGRSSMLVTFILLAIIVNSDINKNIDI